MINEKHLGCLGYIGDDKLPSYVGILINPYKDPYKTTRIQWKVRDPGFFRGSHVVFHPRHVLSSFIDSFQVVWKLGPRTETEAFRCVSSLLFLVGCCGFFSQKQDLLKQKKRKSLRGFSVVFFHFCYLYWLISPPLFTAVAQFRWLETLRPSLGGCLGVMGNEARWYFMWAVVHLYFQRCWISLICQMSSVCYFGWWQVLEEYLKWRWGTMPSNLGACPSGAGSVAAMRLVLMAQGDSNDILRQFRPVRDCTVSCFAPKKGWNNNPWSLEGFFCLFHLTGCCPSPMPTF